MNKIQETVLKIFNWGKKHKVSSVLLCLLLAIFCFKGIVWIYNDINYGRFVKVGEKYFDDIPYSSLYETYHHQIQFFIPLNPSKNNSTFIRKITKKLDDTPISYLPDEIYKINNDFNYIEKVSDGFFYNLNTEDEKLKISQDVNEFDNRELKPVIKILSKDGDRIVNIGTNKTVVLKNVDNTGKIIKLNDENILLFFHEIYKDSNYKYSYRYSLKDNKLYQLNTSEIPYLSSLHNKLIYLGNNKFLFLQSTTFDKLTGVILFTLENNKFIKHELKMPHNNPLFGFSTNNPLVLNENQVLFVGGTKGELDISWHTKQCFLYNIKQNKIVKINDFPFYLGRIRAIKTQNNKFYIPTVILQNNHTKHFIYKYKRGRFTL